MGVRCTSWCSRDAHRPACISGGAATSCGFTERSAVAQEPFGAWRVATPGAQVPGSGAGPGLLAYSRPRALLGSLPQELSLREGERRAGAGAPGSWSARRTAHRPANGSYPPSRSGTRRLSGRDCWLGVTRSGGEDGAVRLHPLRRRLRHGLDGDHSQPRPRSADRHRRSASRDATASAPATWTAGAVSGRTEISCPATPKVNRTRRSRHRNRLPAIQTGLPAAEPTAMPRSLRSPLQRRRQGA